VTSLSEFQIYGLQVSARFVGIFSFYYSFLYFHDAFLSPSLLFVNIMTFIYFLPIRESEMPDSSSIMMHFSVQYRLRIIPIIGTLPGSFRAYKKLSEGPCATC